MWHFYISLYFVLLVAFWWHFTDSPYRLQIHTMYNFVSNSLNIRHNGAKAFTIEFLSETVSNFYMHMFLIKTVPVNFVVNTVLIQYCVYYEIY